ncbi:MAG: hypothetical protein SFZ24_05985 [Planctomycetota bacterium]|nr:hypothetical protein [Planctomycetota bacterium]
MDTPRDGTEMRSGWAGGRSLAPLWASAFVLAGLIVGQAGRFTGAGPEAAYAGNVTSVGGLTMLTADAGNGDEILAVINPVDESISFYFLRELGRKITLIESRHLSQLFEQARGEVRTGGRR